MKNLIKLLAETDLIPLGLTAASAADARMHTKILGSAAATLIISYDEIEGIMKIVRYLEDSCLLLKEAKKKKKNSKWSKRTRKRIPWNAVLRRYVNRQRIYKSRIWFWAI